MNFTPLRFQAPLAAGGIALMAFNYLQFAVPHGEGVLKLSDIPWGNLTVGQLGANFPLIAIMLVSIIANLILTTIFFSQLTQWISNREDYKSFMGNSLINIGIFIPIASLAMTLNVIWGPLAFFVPNLQTQKMMMPSLLFFGLLWLSIFLLEFKVLKTLLTKSFDTCLYGMSLYRMLMYLQAYFLFDVKTIAFFLITFSYVITVGWGLFTIYLLSEYLKKEFYGSNFSPPQWAMV